MKKVENFFILFSTSTYDEYVAYNFVDFRLKRAYRANYRGATFLPPAERQVKRQKKNT